MAGAAAALTVARDEGRGRGGEGQPDGGGDARVGEVGRDLRAALVARPAGAVQPQHEAAGRGALRRRRRHRLGPEFGGREWRTDESRPAISGSSLSFPWWLRKCRLRDDDHGRARRVSV
jgi:hypothetical protein